MSSKNKQRIIIIHNLPSGGAKNLMKANLEYLRRYFNVLVFQETVSPTEYLSFLQYLKLALFGDISWEKRVISKVKETDKIVYYHSWLTKSPRIMRFLKNKSLYICHEPLREFTDKLHIQSQTYKERIVNLLRLPLYFQDKLNVENTSMVVANSKYSKKVLSGEYKKKIIVVYPGIVSTKVNNLASKNEVINLLTVGSINKLKNQLFLVKVAGELSKYLRIKLTIVGNGANSSYLNKINALIKEFPNLNVEIKINLSNIRLSEEYKKTQGFLYAPVNEPFGLVILEALNYGIPIFSYRYGGGYSEILSKHDGITFKQLNSLEWSKKIRKYFEIHKVEYSIKNNQIARKYNTNIMNENIMQLLKQL